MAQSINPRIAALFHEAGVDLDTGAPANGGMNPAVAAAMGVPLDNEPVAPSAAQLARQTFSALPGYDKALVGAGATTMGLVHGAEQLATAAGAHLPFLPSVRSAARGAQRAVQRTIDAQAPYAAATQHGWGLVGSALPYAAIGLGTAGLGDLAGGVGAGAEAAADSGEAAKAASGLAKLGSVLKPYVVSGLANAGLGALNPETSNAAPDARLLNAGLGAAGGVGGEALGTLGAKAVAAARGKLAPALKDVIDYAQAHNVPLSIGDLGNQAVRAVENISTKLPFTGRAKVLESQAEKAAEALGKLPADVAPKIAARVANGETPEEILANSVRENYDAVRRESHANYARLDSAIHKAGVPKPTTTNAQAAIKNAQNEYDDIFGKGGADLKKSDREAIRSVATQDHAPFGELHRVRSIALKAARAIPRDGNNDKRALLNNIANGIDKDMDAWGSEAPNAGPLLKQYRDAQAFHRENVVPFTQDPSIRPILSPYYNPQNMAGQLTPDKFVSAQRLMQAAGPDGQEAIRYMIARNPITRASVGDTFSVPSFARNAGKAFTPSTTGQTAAMQAFDPATLKTLQTAADFANKIKRAGTAGIDVVNGSINAPLAEGALSVLGTGAAHAAPAVLGTNLGIRAGLGLTRSAPVLKFYAADPLQAFSGAAPWLRALQMLGGGATTAATQVPIAKVNAAAQ